MSNKIIELEMPSELGNIVKHHPEINWNEIASKSMWEYARKLESLNKILSHSKLTESDVRTIGTATKSGLLKKYIRK